MRFLGCDSLLSGTPYSSTALAPKLATSSLKPWSRHKKWSVTDTTRILRRCEHTSHVSNVLMLSESRLPVGEGVARCRGVCLQLQAASVADRTHSPGLCDVVSAAMTQ